MMGIYSAMA
jgi:hypothetical protein